MEKGEIRLSPCGRVVAETWEWLGRQFAGVALDECAIMPDHLHGIVVLTRIVAPVATHGAPPGDTTRRKPLGGIIGAFETRSTAEINRLRGTPGRTLWQRDFWDRVIRDEPSWRQRVSTSAAIP